MPWFSVPHPFTKYRDRRKYGDRREGSSCFSSQSKTTGTFRLCSPSCHPERSEGSAFSLRSKGPSGYDARRNSSRITRRSVFSNGRVAVPLFLGGLPFAYLFHANGGSLFCGSVLSTHCPLLTTHSHVQQG